MWSRIYSKITSNPWWQRFVSLLNSFLGRVEKITPLEVYVVVLVVASVVFINRYFQREANFRFIRMEVTVKEWKYGEGQYDYKVPYWLSEKLELGLTERSLSGRTRAEIVGMEKYDRVNDQSQIYLVVKVMADYNEKSQSYSYQGQPLSVGSPIEFNFDGVLVPGQILDNSYPPSGYQVGEFIITTKARYVEPWVVDELKKGLTMKNRANGEVIAELIDFDIAHSKTKKIDFYDQSLIANSEQYFDIDAKFKIKTVKQNGYWFFAGHQRVRLGADLWIYLENLILPSAEITKLEYVAK